MALRCVPACISLLQDPDSVVRQLAIQSARTLQSRALLLIAKASPAQANNVEAATQALEQLQERIWKALSDGVQDKSQGNLSATEGPFRQACLFVAHQIIITTSSSVFVRPSISAEHRGIASIEDIPQNAFLPIATLTEKANQRLQSLLQLLEQCTLDPDKSFPHHITSMLDAFGFIGRTRPQLLSGILKWFGDRVGQDPWLDTHFGYHTRMFMACH